MARPRRFLAGIAVMGMVMSLALVGTAVAQEDEGSSSSGQQKVTLNIGVDSDITSLNPYNLCCGPDYEVLGLVYDTAFHYDRDTLGPAPGFVKEWTANEDSTEWTLTINTGATWHDGQPVTAEDVAFSFEVAKTIPFYSDYLPFNPTFSVIDDTHVLWKAEEPTFAPNVPAYIPIVPEHIWGKFVVDGDVKATRKAVKDYPNEEDIGSGMFTLAEYKRAQFIRLEVNPDYWGQKPKAITEVVFTVFQNQEAMAQAIKSGEIDYAWDLKPALYNSLQGQPNIALRPGDGGCWGNLAWNFGGQGNKATADPIIHDIEFRQAMARSIDRQGIIDKVYQGAAAEPGHSILMPGTNGSWVQDIPDDLQFNYDPPAAMEQLDAAGYTDTDNDGIRNGPDGKNIDLELLVITDVKGSVDTGKLLQGYFKDVGVDSFFTTVNTAKAYDPWYTGEWDAYVWDWCPDPDPDFMLSVFTTNQCLGWSDGCYSNPEYDELYKLQQTQLDRAERKETIDQMQTIIAEELPTMVLNYWTELDVYRTDKFDPSTWVPSPNNDAGLFLFGWTDDSYVNLQLQGEGAPTASSGIPGWVWGAIVGGVIVVAGVVLVARRRGAAAEDEA